MSGDFEYRPKFIDIRVRKGAGKAKAERKPPAERPCDYVGCERLGAHRAPKGRERVNEYWHFCLDHVTDYNRRWNYFSGMTDTELADYQRREEVGHRPTWTLRGGRGDRLSASGPGMPGDRKADPFGIFGTSEVTSAPEPRRRLTKMQGMALEVMMLDLNADGPQIRARYAELVKRWHPDSNGGDRGAEANLQRVVRAYHVLKTGGLV